MALSVSTSIKVTDTSISDCQKEFGFFLEKSCYFILFSLPFSRPALFLQGRCHQDRTKWKESKL